MSTLQPHDLILKRQDRGGRTEYLLYQYDGSPALKQVDGPWGSEADFASSLGNATPLKPNRAPMFTPGNVGVSEHPAFYRSLRKPGTS